MDSGEVWIFDPLSLTSFHLTCHSSTWLKPTFMVWEQKPPLAFCAILKSVRNPAAMWRFGSPFCFDAGSCLLYNSSFLRTRTHCHVCLCWLHCPIQLCLSLASNACGSSSSIDRPCPRGAMGCRSCGSQMANFRRDFGLGAVG